MEESRDSALTHWITPLGWLAAVCAMFTAGLWLVSWWHLRHVIRHSQSLDSEQVRVMLGEYANQLGIASIPELRVSNSVPIGATVGCRRTYLFLNSSWPTWSQSELRAVLAHELAHVARRDFLWVVFSGWVRVLLFFHPLVHVVVRRLRLEQELAADQLAAGVLVNAHAYGRALAKLALRSQPSHWTASSILAAEQICIIRRITMLKQGSLAPGKLWRWASCITLATTFVIVPLSGLRGISPTQAEENSTTANSTVKTDADKTTSSPRTGNKQPTTHGEMLAAGKLRSEVAKKYPPLILMGSLVWRPGRFLSPDTEPFLQWCHSTYYMAKLGEVLETGEVHALGGIDFRWGDFERSFGLIDLIAELKQANRVPAKSMTRLLTNPINGRLRVTDKTWQIEGQSAIGLAIKRGDSPDQFSEIQSWLVDGELGVFHGSEEEIAKGMRGETNPLAEVPARFLEQYQSSAFAVTFANCQDCKSKIVQFFDGSEKEQELKQQIALVRPLVNGLEQAGFFYQQNREADCFLRASYADAASAEQAKTTAEALISMGRTFLSANGNSDDKTLLFQSLLKTMSVKQVEQEIILSFKLSIPERLAAQSQPMSRRTPGWISLDRNYSSQPGEVRLHKTSVGYLPEVLAQTISSKNYRGKRVRWTADLACHDEATSRAGLMITSSGSANRTLTWRSKSVNGGSTLEALNKLATGKTLDDAGAGWHTVSVETNVPVDSECISYGCYAQDAGLRMRNLRFEIIGEANGNERSTKPWTPVNLFVVPHAQLRDEPYNMDFTISGSQLEEPTQVAEREVGEKIKR